MRRLFVVTGAAVALAWGVSGAAMASAPPTTPAPAPTTETSTTVLVPDPANPIVGSWTLSDVQAPDEAPFTGAFLPGGIYIEVDTGNVGIGSWEPTGANTVGMTFTETNSDGSSYTVRAVITVNGDALSADYSVELSPDTGAPPGQYGPGQVMGVRVGVDKIGDMAGTLNDLFGSFDSTPPTSS